MQQILTVLTTLTIIIACTNQNSNDNKTSINIDKDTSLTNLTVQEIENYEQFLGLFEAINPTDLHIYTPDDQEGGRKYDGKRIDQKFYKYLVFNNSRFQSLLRDTTLHFFSCFKFRLSDTKTGLIIRSPSEYFDETSIDLLTWDNSQKK